MRQITKFYPITRKLDTAISIVCVCVWPPKTLEINSALYPQQDGKRVDLDHPVRASDKRLLSTFWYGMCAYCTAMDLAQRQQITA